MNTKIAGIFSGYILMFVFTISGYSTQISGFVRDIQTGEALIGVNVLETTQNSGTTTDNHGYFSLKLETPAVLSFSYVGYKTQNITIQNNKDSLISIKLESGNSLTEVIVTASKNRNFDITRLSAKELSQVPTLGGKPDMIKTLHLFPGVQSQSEGMSLMMVRGGEPGQNQYLLDNVPLIYVNHLGGLMSVFNPDIINTVDFYKGNFPARQGGKLSSIVDITQREGDISKQQGSISLGITDASFSFEGPFANKKMSYIITARKTFIDAFLLTASAISSGNIALAAYGFHDINAKLNWKPNERNNISLNVYQGDDYLNYWTKPWKMVNSESSHINQQWGNWLVSGNWRRVFSSKLYAENIISFSRYRNKSGQKYSNTEEGNIYKIETLNRSSVNDFSIRSSWKYSLMRSWNMEFGAHVGFLLYEPDYNFLSTSSQSQIRNLYQSVEAALYVDNKINLFTGAILQPSLRISNFSNNSESFLELEPRINLSYRLNASHSFNLNYMRVSQNSHLVFAQTELLKREVWLPATSLLSPEISNQLSISWNAGFANDMYSTETNLYYKRMKNLVSLKEGYENMTGITGIENKIESNGKGLAFGAEFMLKKNTGKWTGSLGYGWSHANRIFSNINHGETYEFDFNRPHSFTLLINHNFRKNWSVNAVWILQSGTPYTPALGKYYTLNTTSGNTNLEILYGSKNSARMQPYHRLDIGLNHTTTTKRGNKAIWTFSLYNAYNHINPFGYYYDNDNNIENQTRFDQPLQLFKMGLFSIIPSVAYKVHFDFSKKTEQKENKVKKRYNWLYY